LVSERQGFPEVVREEGNLLHCPVRMDLIHVRETVSGIITDDRSPFSFDESLILYYKLYHSPAIKNMLMPLAIIKS
jgi:hypothetical protein